METPTCSFNTPSPTPSRGRRKYLKPRIELIPLDSEISLSLESDLPIGPEETFFVSPDYFDNPFRNQTT